MTASAQPEVDDGTTPASIGPTRVLTAIAEVQESYIAGRPPGDVFEDLLRHVLAITDSEYGFIGEVLVDDGSPYLKAYAMTDISWDADSRALFEQARRGGGFEFRNHDTLYGAILTTGEPVIANDAPNDPRAGGLMFGHLPLERFLGLPLHSEGELVGAVGVSNRVGGYDEDMVAMLRPFLSTCGNLVRAFRGQRRLAEAEQRARRRDEELRLVVQAASDAIALITPSGDLRTLNDAGRDLVGATVVALDRVLSPTDRESLDDLVASPDGRVATLRVNGVDGRSTVVDVSLSASSDDGEPVWVAILRDATARVATEQALVDARDQAERTVRAHDAFLASVSHELRTPLNAVIGLSDLLASGASGPLTERQQEYARLIGQSGDELLAMVDDVMRITEQGGRDDDATAPVAGDRDPGRR